MEQTERPEHAARDAAKDRAESLTKDQKIRSRGDFKRTYAQGRKVFGRTLVLFLRPNGLSSARLGVTVTRRVGTAVVRNLLRRRVREIYRRGPRPPAGHDLVVNLRESAAAAPFAELSADFERTLARAIRQVAEVRG
jgi:ribonuclease P protein component